MGPFFFPVFIFTIGRPMTVALIKPPSIEPLSLQEVKSHLRIDHDHEDSLLLETLKAARQFTEFSSGQKCITQVWRQYESAFPLNCSVELQIGPVVSIASVTAYDENGEPSLLQPEDYELLRGETPTVLQFSHSMSVGTAANGFEIDATVGFGDLGVDVPDALKRAILLLVAHWYEFRGAVSPQNQPVSLPAGFETLVSQFKQVRI
jgi:uncharacterized phiE125 gp8 family phage protein